MAGYASYIHIYIYTQQYWFTRHLINTPGHKETPSHEVNAGYDCGMPCKLKKKTEEPTANDPTRSMIIRSYCNTTVKGVNIVVTTVGRPASKEKRRNLQQSEPTRSMIIMSYCNTTVRV
jgi:hypothetical protein